MNNYFVDTHCHVFKSDYENIDEVLKNASNNHIKYVINNGSNNEKQMAIMHSFNAVSAFRIICAGGSSS